MAGVIRPLPGQGRAQGSAARAGKGAAGRGLGCRPRLWFSGAACHSLRVTRSARSRDRVRSRRKPHRQFQGLTNLEAREGRLRTAEAASDFLTHTGRNTQEAETKKLAELTAEN